MPVKSAGMIFFRYFATLRVSQRKITSLRGLRVVQRQPSLVCPLPSADTGWVLHPLERIDRRGSPRRWHRQWTAVYHSYRRGHWSKNLLHLSWPFLPSAKVTPKLQTRKVKAAKMRKACVIKSRRLRPWWNSRSDYRMFPLCFFDFTSNNCKNEKLI